MAKSVELTDSEIQLLLALLQAEDRELPAEIHHSDTFKMRKDLRARQKTFNAKHVSDKSAFCSALDKSIYNFSACESSVHSVPSFYDTGFFMREN